MKHASYALTFLLAAGCASTTSYVQKIQESERSGVCYVHHEDMKKERLRIAYGLIGYSKKFTDARLSKFPFAQRAIFGGCVIITVLDQPELNSPEFGEAYVCPKCSDAKTRWENKHPGISKSEVQKEPNQPIQRNASTGSVSNFQPPARRG